MMILKMKINIIPALLFLLQSCEANPPSLAGDTLVNTLLSQNSKHAGLRGLEKDSELIREPTLLQDNYGRIDGADLGTFGCKGWGTLMILRRGRI